MNPHEVITPITIEINDCHWRPTTGRAGKQIRLISETELSLERSSNEEARCWQEKGESCHYSNYLVDSSTDSSNRVASILARIPLWC